MTTQTVVQEQTASPFPEATDAAAPLATRPTVVREPPKPAAADAEGKPTQVAYRHSESFGRIVMALSQAQGEFQDIEKTLTATVTSRREGARSYTYHYADLAAVLAAVRPALSKYGLALMQFPKIGRGFLLVTTFIGHGESGEWFAGDFIVELPSLDPQTVGSATTYARRYGATALLGVAAGETDDDGQAASRNAPAEAKTADPVGFENWLLDLEASADNGVQALTDAWKNSKPEFRNHLLSTHKARYEAIKAKAKTVTVSANGGR